VVGGHREFAMAADDALIQAMRDSCGLLCIFYNRGLHFSHML